MNYNQKRPDHYNWFKDQKNDDKNNKEKIKSGLKTTWKFSKIFLIFSVLFFSLYGCVQSFIIKQSNTVGKGLEFYLSEKDVSPHITTFQQEKIADSTIKSIYLPISDKAKLLDSKLSNDKKELENVAAFIKTQNINNNLKLSDAYRGINEGVYFDGLNNQNKVSSLDNNKPAVLSSKATTGYNYVLPAKYPYDQKIEIKNYIYDEKATGNFLKKEDTNKYSVTLNKFSNDEKHPEAEVRQSFLHWALIKSKILDFLKEDAPANLTKEKAINFVASKTLALNALTGFFGFKVSNTDKYNLEETKNYMLGMGIESTDYRPIITWEDAWVRGVGPFYGLFVFPISKLIISITSIFPIMSGWESVLGIIFSVILLRFFASLLTLKSKILQGKTQELTAKKAKIDAKYAPYKGNKQMEMRQRQEVADLYKKEKMNPFAQMIAPLVTMPIFLSMWRTIGSIPHLKATTWLGMNFASTSWKELFAGEAQYLPLMLIALSTSILSQLLSRILAKKRNTMKMDIQTIQAMKKNNKTQNIIMAVFAFMSVIFTAGVQLYWIITSLWTITETYATHKYLVNRSRKERGIVVESFFKKTIKKLKLKKDKKTPEKQTKLDKNKKDKKK